MAVLETYENHTQMVFATCHVTLFGWVTFVVHTTAIDTYPPTVNRMFCTHAVVASIRADPVVHL